MKRLFCLPVAALLLAGCTAAPTDTAAEYTLAPWTLTEDQQQLLAALGKTDQLAFFRFSAPVTSATLTIYRLEDGVWVANGGGEIGTAGELARQPMTGTLALELEEDYRISGIINFGGCFSATSDPILPDSQPTASARAYLTEPMPVDQGEIPVALLVYDAGNQLPGYTVQDFFAPETLADYDLVQAVTMTFGTE